MRHRQRHWLVALAMLLALGVGAGCGTGDKGAGSASGSGAHGEEKLAELTLDEVEARIAKNDGNFYVFDNNKKEVYDEGHVPTAKWVPFNDLKEEHLPANKDATLVFYCSNPR